MKPMTGFINIYKSGWFHRKGKPGMLDRHPGDIYLTMEAAQQDIDPQAAALYVGTVPIMWIEPDDSLAVNPADSQPEPLRESRRKLGEYTVPSQIEGLHDNVIPLQIARAREEVRRQWRANETPAQREARLTAFELDLLPVKKPVLAIEYKPTHGGYPDA